MGITRRFPFGKNNPRGCTRRYGESALQALAFVGVLIGCYDSFGKKCTEGNYPSFSLRKKQSEGLHPSLW